MRTSIMSTACFALSFAAIAAPAQAQPGDQDPVAALESADANGDGTVTWTEVVDRRSGIFARLDRNGDGYADSEDRPRMGAGRYDAALMRVAEQFDADGDGRVSRAEMLDGPNGLFVEVDTNEDSALSPDEIEAFRAKAAAAR